MLPIAAFVTRLAAPALAAFLLLAASCGAPPSRAAKGPVADEVRAARDSGSDRFDHAVWGQLLADGTRDGRVDYDFFTARRGDLDAYLARVAEADLASLTGDQLMALLINAYNALTIRSILDHPGVDSIREIDGVWTEAKHRVGGHELTLDEIEHNLLRPFYRDPRIHFAVNCASASCAPLPPWAYDGEILEDQLDERARSFLTDPANVRVEEGVLLLSKYFDWYGGDFTAEGWQPRAETVAGFVALYAEPEVAELIRAAGGEPEISFLDYDWSLNEAE